MNRINFHFNGSKFSYCDSIQKIIGIKIIIFIDVNKYLIDPILKNSIYPIFDCLKMFGTYIPNEKFDAIRISVLSDVSKILKNRAY